ncbi:hypothetical protein FACS189459_0010 [Bacilli bacterium]|nr:hypothetical protein FACS189459_0010 [Bacilli bacterium]GHU51990.1 hypothetical protein FACS189496_1330 [Bacilli bacterium]
MPTSRFRHSPAFIEDSYLSTYLLIFCKSLVVIGSGELAISITYSYALLIPKTISICFLGISFSAFSKSLIISNVFGKVIPLSSIRAI